MLLGRGVVDKYSLIYARWRSGLPVAGVEFRLPTEVNFFMVYLVPADPDLISP